MALHAQEKLNFAFVVPWLLPALQGVEYDNWKSATKEELSNGSYMEIDGQVVVARWPFRLQIERERALVAAESVGDGV